VKGTGLIAATGKITVKDGAALDPGNKAVLLAGKGASLTGKGRASSTFQGVVYSEGPFEADGMSVLGAFVAGPGGSLNLKESAAIQVGPYTELDFKVRLTTVGKNGTIGLGSDPMVMLETSFDEDGVPFGQVRVTPGSWYQIKHQVPPDERTKSFEPNSAAYFAFIESVIQEYLDYYAQPWVQGPNGIGTNLIRSFLQGSPPPYMVRATVPAVIPETHGPDGWVQSSAASGNLEHKIRFHLNEFLNLEDRLKVVLWREL
jgi:hypothetical protein